MFFPWKVAPHSPLVPIVRLSRVISSLWRLVQVVSWFDVTGQLTNKRERIFQFSSTLAFDTVVPYLTKAYMGIVRPQLAGISRFNHEGPKTWCLEQRLTRDRNGATLGYMLDTEKLSQHFKRFRNAWPLRPELSWTAQSSCPPPCSV